MAISKLLLFDSNPDKTGEPLIYPAHDGLIKSASASVHPDTLEYLAGLEDPDAGKVRAIITALSAYDSFGANKNGDGFHREHLVRDNEYEQGLTVPMYKSFEHFARPYRHHINSPNSPSYGRVLHSAYNDRMDRVELVVEVDADRAPDIVRAIENYEPVSTSMGFRAKYDVCSICGNYAKTRRQYCHHLKTQMLRVAPDGRLVYAINPYGKFFDISFVSDPADLTSRAVAANQVMESADKVASVSRGTMVYLSADLAKVANLEEPVMAKSARQKQADIKKRIYDTAEVVANSSAVKRIREAAQKLRGAEPHLSKEAMDVFADHFEPSEILNSFSYAGINLKPEEVQYMGLRSLGFPKVAAKLWNCGALLEHEKTADVFDLNPAAASPYLLDAIAGDSDLLINRSGYTPWLAQRLDKVGSAMGTNPYYRHRMMAPPEEVQALMYQESLRKKEETESKSVLRYLMAILFGARWARERQAEDQASSEIRARLMGDEAHGVPSPLLARTHPQFMVQHPVPQRLIMTAPIHMFNRSDNMVASGMFPSPMDFAFGKEAMWSDAAYEAEQKVAYKLERLDKVATRITSDVLDMYGEGALGAALVLATEQRHA
jgi:hypothetical protein